MRKILITGANGQLGKALNEYYAGNKEFVIISTDIGDIDIANYQDLEKKIRKESPNIIINCAAYTDVEKCEVDKEGANLVNSEGVKNICLIAKKMDIVVVHVSTDYVFDGDKIGEYVEDDLPNPSSVYGKTKYLGEKYVIETLDKYFIVRTAWLYGDGKNFVRSMLKLSQKKKIVDVVSDQKGSPTSSKEVAKVIGLLLQTEKYGLYHATCEGSCSWAEFAKEIFKLAKMDTQVRPVRSKEYFSAVQRPKNSVLENKKLRENLGYTMSNWEDSIKEFLTKEMIAKIISGKKVLVTGANGYVGRHVVKGLLDKGYDVLAADFNFSDVDKRAKYISAPIFSGDSDIYQQLGEPDICIHLAWRNGFVHNDSSHIDDLSEHYKFIKNMISGGLKQIAVMGTMHEVGYWEGAIDENTPTNPTSLYGIAKNALRQMVGSLAKENDTCLLWLRAYYIMGDDLKNNSIFSKLVKAEQDGKTSFPLNSGKNKYDFIMVEELANQIIAASIQTRVSGIINCSTGKPVSLGNKVEEFIKQNHYSIKLEYGVFPDRPYDSPAVWGCSKKIEEIMQNTNLSKK